MLLQIKNFRFWMKAKMGQRGAALVEYAILLAFVAVIGAAFIGSSDGTLAGNITKIVDNIKGLLGQAAGTDGNGGTPVNPPANGGEGNQNS